MLRCNDCDRAFDTKGGYDLHMKVFHTPKKVVEVTKPTRVKKNEISVLTAEEMEKRSKDFTVRHKKRSKRGPMDLTVGEKLTKQKVCSLFKDDPLIGQWWEEKALSKILKRASYKVTCSKDMSNDWKQYTLQSRSQSVSWKEGPIRGAYSVSLPSVIDL